MQLRASQEGAPPAAPVLVSTWGSGATASLVFSMPMSESAATNTANYSVVQDGVGPITVTGASLSPDGKSVTLTLSAALVLDSPYTITANNLTGSNGGVLANGTTGQFRTWDNDPNGIKVFILAGQSNMVGYGSVETGKDGVSGAIGSLRYMAVNDTDGVAPHYRDLLVDPGQPATSAWKTRNDGVKVWWMDGTPGGSRTLRKGDLKPSFGNQIGPEYGFGQVLGDHFTQPVLIIKAAWGGKSLAVDFRPPGAVAARGGSVGTYYTAIIDDVRDALSNLATDFPEWAGQGYQIAGFGWHQGMGRRWQHELGKRIPGKPCQPDQRSARRVRVTRAAGRDRRQRLLWCGRADGKSSDRQTGARHDRQPPQSASDLFGNGPDGRYGALLA